MKKWYIVLRVTDQDRLGGNCWKLMAVFYEWRKVTINKCGRKCTKIEVETPE